MQSTLDRYILFPIQDHDIFNYYKQHVQSFWKPQEIDYTKDAHDWNTMLTDTEREYLANILGFFAGADGVVIDNTACRFLMDVNDPSFSLRHAAPEIRQFYAMQICIEAIHAETYSNLIENCVPGILQQRSIFERLAKSPCIEHKVNWALKWMNDSKASFAQRLVGFICVEGIFFSSSFAGIFWIKEKGILRGITQANEYISRDENLHTDFAQLLYSKLPESEHLPPDMLRSILTEACDVEIAFVKDILPMGLPGMNASLMASYVRYVTNRISLVLGGGTLYTDKNPFGFMVHFGLYSKENFFERRSTQYAGATQIYDSIDMDHNSLFNSDF